MSKHHYIGGTWVQSSGPSLISTNPATGELLWEGREATHDDIDSAYSAARAGFPLWSKMPLERRISFLEAFKERVNRRLTLLSEALCQETGKPFWEAVSELHMLMAKISISIDAYHKRAGQRIAKLSGFEVVTRHRPHGIVAVFAPPIMPLNLSHGHIIPALLAGNCVIFKPSELTPLVSSLITECWDQVNCPPGVFNLLQGGTSTAHTIASHYRLDGLYYTGNSELGLSLAQQFGRFPQKILALEMGGNNPLVVWDIDDLTASAYLTIQSAFLSSGQRATNAKRLIIPSDSEGDIFIQTLIAMMRSIRIGPYYQRPEPFMGSLISQEAALACMQKQEELKEKGGIPLIEMQHLVKTSGFVSPGLIDVTNIRLKPDSEFYGPLLQVIRVATFEEAIAEANRTSYGLAAGLISKNPGHYEQFYQSTRSGLINWNCPTTGASSNAPFGGIKHSGNHRPTSYYAADYCSYPVSSMETAQLTLPTYLLPGISVTYSLEQPLVF